MTNDLPEAQWPLRLGQKVYYIASMLREDFSVRDGIVWNYERRSAVGAGAPRHVYTVRPVHYSGKKECCYPGELEAVDAKHVRPFTEEGRREIAAVAAGLLRGLAERLRAEAAELLAQAERLAAETQGELR